MYFTDACPGDADEDVLPYPAPAIRQKKATKGPLKYFVLTSKEAHAAKLQQHKDKLQREKDKVNRKKLRAENVANRAALKEEKAAAAEKRKLERSLLTKSKKTPKKRCLAGAGLPAESRTLDTECQPEVSAADQTPTTVDLIDSVHSMAEPRPRPNECGTLVNPVIGDYVKVNFEGTYYPGEVIDVSDEGICVSVLHKSGAGPDWKWPKPADSIYYSLSEIKQKIQKPVAGKRGRFSVPEMNSRICDMSD